MAVEGNVDNDSPPPASNQAVRSTPPVTMRWKPPGRTPSARPISQPPPGVSIGAAASHGSDDNLTDGSSASCISRSN